MEGFAVGFGSGIATGVAIGIGAGMASGQGSMSKALKKLADEGEIRITDREGRSLTGAQLLELLSATRRNK